MLFLAVAKLPVLQSVRQSAVPWNTRVQTSELSKKEFLLTRDNSGINNGN